MLCFIKYTNIQTFITTNYVIPPITCVITRLVGGYALVIALIKNIFILAYPSTVNKAWNTLTMTRHFSQLTMSFTHPPCSIYCTEAITSQEQSRRTFWIARFVITLASSVTNVVITEAISIAIYQFIGAFSITCLIIWLTLSIAIYLGAIFSYVMVVTCKS